MAQFRRRTHPGCVSPSSPHIDGGRCACQQPISARKPDRTCRIDLKVRQEGKGVKQTEERERLHGPELISS